MRNVLVRALISGSAGSIVSAIALAACGMRELGDPAAPLNGPSQWFFGRPAAKKRGFSLRHTVSGYLVHHAMSIFWASLFERFRRQPVNAALDALLPAVATSAVACFVDFRLTPPRLTPGFEQQLSRKSLAVVYVAFVIGLVTGAAIESRRRP